MKFVRVEKKLLLRHVLQPQGKSNSVSWCNTAGQTVQFILFVRSAEEGVGQEVMVSSRWMHEASTLHRHPFVYLAPDFISS